MNIVSFQFTLLQRSLEIYLSGCYAVCEGCHNEELRDFDLGTPYKEKLNEIDEKIKTGLVKKIWVLGGEPLDQDLDELEDLLIYLKRYNLPIWLFTRQEINDVPERIKKYCSYIKTGYYKKDDESYVDPETGITLASRNQKIIKID